MRDLAKSGMTMLVVTHELNFARNVSSRGIFMLSGLLDTLQAVLFLAGLLAAASGEQAQGQHPPSPAFTPPRPRNTAPM